MHSYKFLLFVFIRADPGINYKLAFYNKLQTITILSTRIDQIERIFANWFCPSNWSCFVVRECCMFICCRNSLNSSILLILQLIISMHNKCLSSWKFILMGMKLMLLRLRRCEKRTLKLSETNPDTLDR